VAQHHQAEPNKESKIQAIANMENAIRLLPLLKAQPKLLLT